MPEAEPMQLPHTDALTGIATLTGFRDHVRRSMARARRRGDLVAIVLLDLDRFGRVNERHGHDTGDRVLRLVAERLVRTVREHDAVARVTGGDADQRHVSRVGGDKFVILLEELASSRMAASVVKRILRDLETPFPVGEVSVSLGARAGISLFPGDGRDEAELLQCAEAAIQRAKTSSGRLRFFSRTAALRHQQEAELEAGLREAIAADSFGLAYQPKVLHPGGEPVGFEALLRYEHPERGAVPAPRVIDLAERSGLIHDLGRAIFRRVCRDATRLHRETGARARLFANFSPAQMESSLWRKQTAQVLEETGVDPALVGMEITESLFVKNRASLVRALTHFASRGIEISLDDFGTGYSSLGYLTRLPLHELKIDRSFVAGMTESAPGSREVTGLLIILGRTLGLRVVAEGVETDAQLDLVHGMGCRVIQGYYYSRPHPLRHFLERVRNGRLEPARESAPA